MRPKCALSASVWLPALFVTFLFSSTVVGGPRAARALDEALPRATAPTAILLNPPAWSVAWYQAAMRASSNEAGPPALALYAGMQKVQLERRGERTLELHVARSWYATSFDSIGAPFRAGARVELPASSVEVLEVSATGAPTRVRLVFARPLEDPSLAFWLWTGPQLARWTPPSAGSAVLLPASSSF